MFSATTGSSDSSPGDLVPHLSVTSNNRLLLIPLEFITETRYWPGVTNNVPAGSHTGAPAQNAQTGMSTLSGTGNVSVVPSAKDRE